MLTSLSKCRYLASETKPERVVEAVSEVAFVGRSNVGKSSLINALCGRDIAYVSGNPGRTRCINIFDAGQGRFLVDLPGYGFAKGPLNEILHWGPMIEAYLSSRTSLRMVVMVVDANVGPTPLDSQMAFWLNSQKIDFCVTASKTDKVKPSKSFAQKKTVAKFFEISPEELFWVNSKNQDGIAALRAEILKALE